MATGWNARPTIDFLPRGIDAELGIPYRASEPDPAIAQADAEVFAALPRIRQQPASLRRASPDEAAQTLQRPYILHRHIIPPTEKFGRSIAFLGAVGSTQTYLLAELSSYVDLSSSALTSQPLGHRLVDRSAGCQGSGRRHGTLQCAQDHARALLAIRAWPAGSTGLTSCSRWALRTTRTSHLTSSRYLTSICATSGCLRTAEGAFALTDIEADDCSWLDGVQPYSKLDYRGVIDEWQRSRQGSVGGKRIE